MSIESQADEALPAGSGLAYVSRDIAAALAPLNAAVVSRVTEAMQPFRSVCTEQFAGLARNLAALSDHCVASVAPVNSQLFWREFGTWLQQWAVKLRSAVPPNWVDREEADREYDWDAVLEIMNEGIPLVWVPRVSVVGKLIAAQSTERRRQVLIEVREDVIADCELVLSDVSAANLMPLRVLAAKSALTLRDGHSEASQALSANIFDTWLRDAGTRGTLFVVQPRRSPYKALLENITLVSEDTPVAELKESGALTPIVLALREFWPGDPVPAEFGRHATAHAAGTEQYSEVNALIALMLTTSVLRQAQASQW